MSVGQYLLLVMETGRGLYRIYVSIDGRWFCHCDTVEHPGHFYDVVDAIQDNFDPRLFEINPMTPFTKEEVLAKAPHAFDGHQENST
ncbi:MAG: hypothetical protein HYS53_03515 [Candidatus Aenigmarchaeota archaeon]|nr:hypothetical protein [Candidatus Aenigmarchaeota archaeon]